MAVEFRSQGYPLEFRSVGNPVAVTLGTQKISEGSTRQIAVDLAEDTNYAFTGTPTVAEVTTTDLTITSPLVNTASLEVLGADVAIGYAVTFFVAGHQSGTTYRVRITATNTNSEVVVRDVLLECV